MFKPSIKFCMTLMLCLLSMICHGKNYLRPEEAFQIKALLTQEGLSVTFNTVPGYYIYQESMLVHAQVEGALQPLIANVIPVANEKYDENFQKIVRTYIGEVTYTFAHQQLPKQTPLDIEVQVQGCADKGICYPPMTRYIRLMQYDNSKVSVATKEELTLGGDKKTVPWWQAKDDLNALNRILEGSSTPVLLGIFFLLGLGLAFTPCMLPMLPILSSVLFGATSNQKITRKKTITLALLYILGMALAFSLAGMATAWFGAGVSSLLQNPIVVIGFGCMMIALSFSLLGFYELRLPHAWNQMVHQWMNRHQGGNLFGVFMLGALSSLIASPCVTAPLAGVLTFIAQSGKVELGGLILFVMALGMGLPLMLFAIGARSLVPKAGSWMLRVQRILAIVLIGFAVWMIYPAMNNLLGKHSEGTSKNIAGLDYQVVRTLDDLRQVIKNPTQQNTGTVIIYYADWCVSCKEIEKTILNQEAVKAQLQKLNRIEVDVTQAGKDQKELLNEYELFGPPALIFINAKSQEEQRLRTVGVISAEKLQEKLRLLTLQ